MADTAAAGSDRLKERYAAALMPNYGVPPVALARGEGCVVWDVDDNAYLDLIGGIAVRAPGHAPPALVAALSKQGATLAPISKRLPHEVQGAPAARRVRVLDAGR